MKTENGEFKKDLLHMMIADAVIILICLGVGALIGLCVYGTTTVGILYMIRMMCFLTGGTALLAGAFMILHKKENKKDIGNAAEKRKSSPLFKSIPLFAVCLQAGALAIVTGVIADSIIRSLILSGGL